MRWITFMRSPCHLIGWFAERTGEHIAAGGLLHPARVSLLSRSGGYVGASQGRCVLGDAVQRNVFPAQR